MEILRILLAQSFEPNTGLVRYERPTIWALFDLLEVDPEEREYFERFLLWMILEINKSRIEKRVKEEKMSKLKGHKTSPHIPSEEDYA